MRYFERQPLDAAIQAQLNKKQAQLDVEQPLLSERKTPSFSPSKKQRSEVTEKLMASQKALCCYCECRISSKKKEHHVEHFKERHDVPTAVYVYENMLLSCGSSENPKPDDESETEAQYRKSNISCGQGKERGRHGKVEINPALLLNPTDKGVSELFSYRDGIVEPSKECTVEQIEQVEYTKTRLNLNSINLKDNRKEQINQTILLLDVLPEELQKNYIRALLDENQAELEPYFSTIKDNFGFLLLS